MRLLYISSAFLLTLIWIVSLMAFSADLYYRYEVGNRLQALDEAERKVPARIVEKRWTGAAGDDDHAVRQPHLYLELLEGERRGTVMVEPVSPEAYGDVEVGDMVTALLLPDTLQIMELERPNWGRAWLFGLISLLSLVGSALLIQRVRRTPG